MAYDPTIPPSLIGQGIGGTEGLRFFAFVWIDPVADVLAPGYISNAELLGMRVGDGLIYKDTAGVGEWQENHLVVTDIDADGAGTLGFPEVPEEALPLEPDFDPDDPNTYLVAFFGGRQVRILPAALMAGNIADQAEAEAGTDNEKIMSPLRTKQATAFQVPALITALATKATPVDADAVVLTDSAAAGAPKRLTWLGLLNSVWTRLGGLIAGGTSKATPVDGDSLPISDSAAAGATKMLTFANLKVWARDYLLGFFVRYDAAQVITTAQQAEVRKTIGLENGYPLLHVVDEKAVGTVGGTPVAAAWTDRVLNTVRVNEISGASVAANQITLPVGTYEAFAEAPVYRGNFAKLRLRNITDGVTIMVGGNQYAPTTADGSILNIVSGRFTLAATKVVSLQHYIFISQAGNGLGTPASTEVEVYAAIQIRKLK